MFDEILDEMLEEIFDEMFVEPIGVDEMFVELDRNDSDELHRVPAEIGLKPKDPTLELVPTLELRGILEFILLFNFVG